MYSQMIHNNLRIPRIYLVSVTVSCSGGAICKKRPKLAHGGSRSSFPINYMHRRQDWGKCRHFEFVHCGAKSTIYIKYGKFITFTYTFSPSYVLVSQKICDQLYSSFQSVSTKGKHLPADQMEFCQIALQPPKQTDPLWQLFAGILSIL